MRWGLICQTLTDYQSWLIINQKWRENRKNILLYFTSWHKIYNGKLLYKDVRLCPFFFPNYIFSLETWSWFCGIVDWNKRGNILSLDLTFCLLSSLVSTSVCQSNFDRPSSWWVKLKLKLWKRLDGIFGRSCNKTLRIRPR